MADVDPDPRPAPAAMQASADEEKLLSSPSPCSEGQQMERPPPYSRYNPPHVPYCPQDPGLEAQHQCSSVGLQVTAVYQGYCLQVSGFEDKSIRLAFIRKVFSVVTLQLVFTFSIVCVFTFSSVVKQAVQSSLWMCISSYIIFLVVSLCLILCRSFSRLYPWNLVGLGLVTLSLSYMVGTVASRYSTPAVVIAMGSTLVISFAIIIFTAQTKVDLTICNGILVVLGVNLLTFGFLSIFFYSTMSHVIYGCLGALAFSMFLAVDCQLVMGRETYSLSPEEYVFAELILYLDMINIFLYIMALLGGGSNN